MFSSHQPTPMVQRLETNGLRYPVTTVGSPFLSVPKTPHFRIGPKWHHCRSGMYVSTKNNPSCPSNDTTWLNNLDGCALFDDPFAPFTYLSFLPFLPLFGTSGATHPHAGIRSTRRTTYALSGIHVSHPFSNNVQCNLCLDVCVLHATNAMAAGTDLLIFFSLNFLFFFFFFLDPCVECEMWICKISCIFYKVRL